MPVLKNEKADNYTKDNYTVISNTIVRNTDLSLKGIAVLIHLLTLSDGCEFSVSGIATNLNIGVDSTRIALKELETKGYLTRTQERIDGKFCNTIYTVYEQPLNKTVG